MHAQGHPGLLTTALDITKPLRAEPGGALVRRRYELRAENRVIGGPDEPAPPSPYTFVKTAQAFWPPKPKPLARAARTVIFRATFGT